MEAWPGGCQKHPFILTDSRVRFGEAVASETATKPLDTVPQWLIIATMIKTQIQMPDYLYREAKRISEQYEMSMAEVVRRGLERVIPSYPDRAGAEGEWTLPVLDLGLRVDPFEDPDWREKASADLEEVGR